MKTEKCFNNGKSLICFLGIQIIFFLHEKYKCIIQKTSALQDMLFLRGNFGFISIYNLMSFQGTNHRFLDLNPGC